MAELQNTRSRIDCFFEEKRRLFSKIYNISQCSNAQQLKDWMENESMLLLDIQHEITDELRKCCYEGMRADGVKHPEVLWALYIGSRYAPIYFPTIRNETVQEEMLKARQMAGQQAYQNAPREQTTVDSAERQNKKLLGVGSAGVGVGCVVVGGFMNPMSIGLMMLGIVMTTVGTLVLLNEKNDRESAQQIIVQPEASPAALDERSIVFMILQEQVKRCTSVLREYCDQAYRFACEAVQNENDERSGENTP